MFVTGFVAVHVQLIGLIKEVLITDWLLWWWSRGEPGRDWLSDFKLIGH